MLFPSDRLWYQLFLRLPRFLIGARTTIGTLGEHLCWCLHNTLNTRWHWAIKGLQASLGLRSILLSIEVFYSILLMLDSQQINRSNHSRHCWLTIIARFRQHFTFSRDESLNCSDAWVSTWSINEQRLWHSGRAHREIMGSNPAGCWAFSLLYLISSAFLIRCNSTGGSTLLIFL